MTALMVFEDLYCPLTVFPVVTYGCESWTTEKAEDRKTDAFCGAGEDS